MKKTIIKLLTAYFFIIAINTHAQPDSIVLRDITWSNSSPAGFIELKILSGNSVMQGFIYKANGGQKHQHYYYCMVFPGTSGTLT